MLNKGEAVIAVPALLAFLYVMWGFESPSSFYNEGARGWEVKKYGVFGYYTKASCAMMPSRGDGMGGRLPIEWPEPKHDVRALESGLTIIVTVAVPVLVVRFVRLRRNPGLKPRAIAGDPFGVQEPT